MHYCVYEEFLANTATYKIFDAVGVGNIALEFIHEWRLPWADDRFSRLQIDVDRSVDCLLNQKHNNI